jgi:hypothetical protein
MIIAPRPFSQFARRNYRLGLPIPKGYRIDGVLFYRQMRRRIVH